jgi:YidC/Oxa1 family membrane protein insertase
MAEFRNPGRENGEGRRSLVVLMIFLACMFFGLQRFSATTGTTAASPHAREVRVEAAKRASPAASGSMNIVEQELFVALAFIHSHVVASWPGSWGWAIVLLTVGINLLLLPLRIASMRSGIKMQRIQPDIAAIKARYKNVKLTDPRHNDMSAEITKLQKDNGVNMFGGCVPLLIQMPLLFAFFGMLRKAAALRGAEWLWLHDLSSTDPFHILPILMVVFQLLVQLYTPSPGTDPTQQKLVTCLMTVGFGYVSWHYASGLALYALTGSLLSIATQAAMNRSALGREMRASSQPNTLDTHAG